jgi:hypothetical protein
MDEVVAHATSRSGAQQPDLSGSGRPGGTLPFDA